MSERTFKNRTKDIDQLLNDPEFAAAIKEHRKAFEQADREYAMGLADVRHAFGLTQAELAEKPQHRPSQHLQNREPARPAALDAGQLLRRYGSRRCQDHRPAR